MRIGLTFGLICACVCAWRASWASTPEEQQAVAAALFDQGRSLMDAGRFEEACDRLAESQKLDPAGGTLMNLAECRSLQGRTSSAFVLYGEALAFARRDRRDDRVEVCERALADLRARLAYVTIVVRDPPAPGLVIRMNGVAVPALAWGSELHVDPGTVIVRAEAPRHVMVEARGVAREAERVTLEVPVLAPERAPPPVAPRAELVPVLPAPRDERAVTAWRGVATVRVDVDGALRGAVTYVGIGAGLGRFVELGAGALLGRSSGLEAGARVFLPLGPIRPFLSAGVPVFFPSGGAAGVRASAGLEWSFHPNVAVLAQAGAVLFPRPPAGYEDAAFVPSFGLVGRL